MEGEVEARESAREWILGSFCADEERPWIKRIVRDVGVLGVV